MCELLRCGLFTILLFNPGYGQTTGKGAKLSGSIENARSLPTTGSSKIADTAITPTIGNRTCPSRTANYITHTLPQQCLRTDRTSSTASNTTSGNSSTTDSSGSAAATLLPGVDETITSEGAESTAITSPIREAPSSGADGLSTSSTSAIVAEASEDSDSPFDTARFLSFEEWKQQNLAKADSDHGGNVPLSSGRQRPGIDNALETLGDEGEIDLDFLGFGQSPSTGPSQSRAAYKHSDGSSPSEVPNSHTRRSKDAGKTCKERTNYASFDCAAQVLKHNPECKSPYSVLVENKDSYMLNICSAQNKFFIVELCNDILIDTVVLANYEFFSSIFRHFRLSVSSRYPVKMEKWIELGTFEAKNTREIQAFWIEHAQIWARYLRIEFLSHYGSEYYCPVSLLRVHGINMLEDIGPHEESGTGQNSEDEASLEPESGGKTDISQDPLTFAQDLIQGSPSQTEDSESLTSQSASNTSKVVPQTDSTATTTSSVMASQDVAAQNESLVVHTLLGAEPSDMICSTSLTNDTPGSLYSSVDLTPSITQTSDTSIRTTPTQEAGSSMPPDAERYITYTNDSLTNMVDANASSSTLSAENATDRTEKGRRSEAESISVTSASVDANTLQPASTSNTSRTVPSTPSSSTPQPQPSTQESFFKSLSKRLQRLESNSTLSLQYIEEQSRILRDAFSKVEKRQISTTSNFLTNLNDTVIKELHGFQRAYDQLWQSTVLELEGQREQYQREMLALSSRLTLVADELLWQKRMGIIQSGLLLLCLGLVLFARTGLQGHLEVPLMQHMMNKSSAALSRAGWESPPASPSPENRSPVALFRRKLWRSNTEPEPERIASGHGTDGDITGTDSRPDTRDGANVNVFVEPPTPPTSRDTDSSVSAEDDDADADDEDEVLDPRESQSGPSTPTGTRGIVDRSSDMANGVIENGVG